MNPEKESEALALAKASDAAGVVVCPPFPFLGGLRDVLKKAALGSQDLFYEKGGPFTGEVSATELHSLGVRYVIIGHSERRQAFSETDEVIAKKVSAALLAGLTPILCIGETASQKAAGETYAVLDRQLKVVLSQLPAGERGKLIVAYEPVWAISTQMTPGGTPPTPGMVAETISYLNSLIGNSGIPVSFIYGGSVNSEDLAAYLAVPGIEGVLVGSASLKPTEFKKMIKIAFSKK